MKKILILGIIILFSLSLLSCDSWMTTTQTFTYEIDDIASTDQDVEMYSLDLTTNEDYAEHRDQIRSVDQVSIVGRITNNLETEASAQIWADTSDAYTTVEGVTNNATLIFATPMPLPGGSITSIDWSDGLEYMENTDYLNDLIINEGQFALYGLAADTPFDITIEAEVVITVTVGR